MADLRETLLAQVLTTLKTIGGVEVCERNLNDIADISLPAIILFDGGEEAFDNTRARGLAANTVEMRPTVDVYIKEVPETIGTEINSWRATVLAALLADATIRSACDGIPNGGMRYLGCETGLSDGRAATMRLSLSLAINYPFLPRAF